MWRSKHPEPLPNVTFHDWTVVEDYRESNKQMKDKLLVRCSCGTEKSIHILNLVNGRSKSCGHTHYANMTEISRRGKHCYNNRVGEQFGNVTLTAYTREANGKHTFAFTCENGHITTFKNMHSTPKSVSVKGHVCWCQKKTSTLQRIRLKKSVTLQDAGQRLNVSRQCVKGYETQCETYGRKIARVRLSRDTDQSVYKHLETKLKESYAFKQLCKGYGLSNTEQDELFAELSYSN